MRKFIIDEQLAQAIANYLATRPYREVAPLVQGLMMLQEAREDISPSGEPQSDKG